MMNVDDLIDALGTRNTRLDDDINNADEKDETKVYHNDSDVQSWNRQIISSDRMCSDPKIPIMSN